MNILWAGLMVLALTGTAVAAPLPPASGSNAPDKNLPPSHEARIKLEEKASEDASPDTVTQSEAEKLESLAPAAGQPAGSAAKTDPLLDIRPLLEQ